MMESGYQEGLPALPSPYAPHASETSSSAAPHDAATKPGCCKRSWRNPSFHTGRLASFHLREEKEGGGKRPGIWKQVEEQVV